MGVELAASAMAGEGLEGAPSLNGRQAARSCGLSALCLLARLHGVAANSAALRHQLLKPANECVKEEEVVLAARSLDLKAKAVGSSISRLSLAPLPALAVMADGGIELLARADGSRVLTQAFQSETGQPPRVESAEGFAERWSGRLILVASRTSLGGELAPFGFGWFIPAIIRHRKLLGEVLLVSVFLQLFALVSPLFFQAVMDKVLVHHSATTLDVLVCGLLLICIFESVLSALRSYVFSHTTNRVDVELGARLYRHLLRLPLDYFQARRVGDSVARVRELEQIRSFLTGHALTLILDLVFSIVFVAVMLAYSPWLTAIVLASLPIYALISIVVVPILRRRLDEKFRRGADSQALLVESITGIHTVKASALEPQLAARWETQLAAYVSASFRAANLASIAHEAVGLTGKLVAAGTLWAGAHLVMQGELTVGMFVAFNMFAGRVAQPVMRLAQMWADFQQTGISMQRLGDILNTRPEQAPSAAGQVPALRGGVSFDRVSFRYRGEGPPVIDDVSLDIGAGEVIGIVGRSGSGKSTLAQLLQRLHSPERGRILVDGIDIALIDAAQLRRQLGVVLQENFLFNRSIRENIAIADPAAPLPAGIQAARLAGAHEFIGELPQGYDTVVGEQGASLSGGQRQRIAIARALFANPRILILDEATSALDYESEAILQRNMGAICKGRTVIIVAHRLTAVRHADRILTMERGRIVEMGAHDVLVRRDGPYARLWRLQSGDAQDMASPGA